MDPRRWLRIEAGLKREKRENIGHQRMIGSYVGKRHAMGLPVRGQNTQTNARTARKLNGSSGIGSTRLGGRVRCSVRCVRYLLQYYHVPLQMRDTKT